MEAEHFLSISQLQQQPKGIFFFFTPFFFRCKSAVKWWQRGHDLFHGNIIKVAGRWKGECPCLISVVSHKQ